MVTLHLVTAELNVVDEFLEFLYGENEGYAYSPTRDPSKGVSDEGYWVQHFFKWPEDREILSKHIETSSPSYDVYISPALFQTPSSLKTSFKTSQVVWAEFDGQLPTAQDLELAGIPEPSCKIQSSLDGYEHWYWSTSNSFVFSDLEHSTRQITYLLKADSSGWDCNQVLRIPRTINHKRNNRLVGDPRYNLSSPGIDLSSIRQSPELAKPLELDLTSLPDVTQVVLKYAWPKYASEHYLTQIFPVGSRSEALMKLGYYCIEMGMNDLETYSILYNADSRWQKFNSRTDRLQRLSEIISRARLKYPTKTNTTSERLQPIGTLSLIRSERKVEWLIPGLLESMGSMLLTGPSGVGKSQFTLNSSIALALGLPFLNFQILKPTKVLFVSLEMGWPQIQWMTEKITQGMSAESLRLLEQNLHIIPLGEPFHLNQESAQKEFEKLLGEGEYDGFIIDSLGSAISGNLGNPEHVQPYIDWIDKTRNKYRCFAWGIHHHRKANGDNKRPNKLDDVYGDQYITARATSVYCLWPTKSEQIEVIPLKKRMDKLEAPWYIERNSNLQFSKVVTNIGFAEPEQKQLPTAPTEPSKFVGV
jgi:hypothetical protein